MIEDDFYATIKLKSGEEIFCKVAAEEESDRTILVVSNPILIKEVRGRVGMIGYKVEPWLKTTTDDMFFINLNDVLTMSESSDIEMILMHQEYVRKADSDPLSGSSNHKLDKKMGYLSNVNDAREVLEKLYNSPSSKDISNS
tara:strand:- start:288 stop:713 length:426 start_codon:yes stop_codon:yes gene_type:complete